jgi:hypothetical protein
VALQPFLSEANNGALPAVTEIEPDGALAEGEVPPSGRKSESFWKWRQPLRIVCWRRIKPVTSRRTVTSSGFTALALRIAQEDPHPRIAPAVLAVVRRTERDSGKRALLVAAGPHLLPDEAKQAWSLALGIKEPDNRVEALAALIASLPQAEYASAIAEILELGPHVPRRPLLSAIRASAAAIRHVGGEVAARKLVALRGMLVLGARPPRVD